MEVVVDGLIFDKKFPGGIARIFNEILPRMCMLEDSFSAILISSILCKQNLPNHPRIFHKKYLALDHLLRPKWFGLKAGLAFRSQLQGSLMRDSRDKIWHSTYYTQPHKWSGPTVVSVYDLIYEHYRNYFNTPVDEEVRDCIRKSVLTAQSVICISETTKQDLQQFYDLASEAIHVIPLACSSEFSLLSEKEILNYDSLPKSFLLYIGARALYKNFIAFVEAYSNWDKSKEVALVVVGRGWSPSERKRLDELGVLDKIHLLRKADDKDLCQLYNRALAFVYPSLYEGFGIPLLEAMACGCPIVASRIPSTIEVAGNCPIYFDPQEIESLLSALNVAWSERRHSNRVLRGLEIAKGYSWDRAAQQTLAVYHSLGR
jgi:glycosyltransferase involved in cell wall biosynthesis